MADTERITVILPRATLGALVAAARADSRSVSGLCAKVLGDWAAQQPKRDAETRARILGAIDDLADTAPEEGESWESWYRAAFYLAREKIGRLLADVAQPKRETKP